MLEIRMQRRPQFLHDGIEIYILDRANRACAQPLQFAAFAEGAEICRALDLGMDEAQMFIDGLWECGLRPTEGTGSAGAMAAVQRHLADMRALVFQSLKMEPRLE